jgi:uncharacterized membrane protein
VFDAQIFQIKQRIAVTVKSGVCALAILMAGAVALVFFCAAGFLWLQHEYGTIDACLVTGAVFGLVALLAVSVLMALQRRARIASQLAAKFAAASSSATPWWNHPSVLAAGLEFSRLFGRKRNLTAGLVGAFVVGMILSNAHKTDAPRDKPKE